MISVKLNAMTFTVEVPAELGAQIERAAVLRGVDAQALIVEATRNLVETVPTPSPKGQRRAAIQAARGSLRGIVNSEEFLARRHEEAARERDKR